jgi:hypothetical protein
MNESPERPSSDDVELYMRTYYSLLRSNSDVQIKTLEQVHAGIGSLLHPGAQGETPDMSAFVYSLLRLPDCIQHVKLVLMGQSDSMFRRAGVGKVNSWDVVGAPARRRRCYYDGLETMACIVASQTDIDDIVPTLTAYQIEWNKLHHLLGQLPATEVIETFATDLDRREELAAVLQISVEDMGRLATIWGANIGKRLTLIASRRCRFHVQLISSTLSEYRRATHGWWKHIEKIYPNLLDRPIYFVSSNTHSLINLLSGFALQAGDVVLDALHNSKDLELKDEWQGIQDQSVPSSQENFLYYLLKKHLQTPEGVDLRKAREEHERSGGIRRINSQHFFDVDAQVMEISRLRMDWMDPRVQDGDLSFLSDSDALILNIDYPLGLAAYNILSKVAEQARQVLGIYIMGKAATLNGVIGDIMIPSIVHDEHSHSTFYIPNAFSAADVAPYLVYGSCMDNQKSLTVRGTFLQNSNYMELFYREGYTDIEMEAGPYLSAIYEMARPKRHPVDRVLNLYNIPFDLGIVHYASDTPLGKGKNLGAATLSYFGMDPTYASTIAVIRRICAMEKTRLGLQRSTD